MEHAFPDTKPSEQDSRELHDERALMGKTAGGLWLLAAAVTTLGQLLPGAVNENMGLFVGLVLVVLAYAIACLTGMIPWDRTPMWGHALGSGIAFLLIPLALWLTGGMVSYVPPLLLCALLYVAFFFPPRFAWPLAAELTLICATPLLYDDPTDHGYLPRLLAMAAAFLVVTFVMGRFKRRLVEAEARQRQMATHDALTEIGNRRAFDLALQRELGVRRERDGGRRSGDLAGAPFAVLFFDLDSFKSINDDYGHPVGDTVLCEVAKRGRAVIRPVDSLARIGGDEFAVVAPGAGSSGARRLAAAIGDAVGDVRPGPGSAPVQVTVGWAVFPDDGRDATSLMRAADQRLHERKRPAPAALPA